MDKNRHFQSESSFRLFFVENGYMAVGLGAMRKGELVCALFGGCVPYILRPTDTDNMYEFVWGKLFSWYYERGGCQLVAARRGCQELFSRCAR